jgi:hypothetical protein
VYRQVALLAGGGLVEVESEERVRGAVERTYRLHRARTAMDLDTAAAMSTEDHHRRFAAAIAALLADCSPRTRAPDGGDAVHRRKQQARSADAASVTRDPRASDRRGVQLQKLQLLTP